MSASAASVDRALPHLHRSGENRSAQTRKTLISDPLSRTTDHVRPR